MRSLLKKIYWLMVPLAEPWYALQFWLQLVRRLGLSSGHRFFRELPPGPFQPIDERMRTDQRALLKLAEQYGPVFKCRWRGQFVVMMLGFERSLEAISTCPHELRSTYKSTDHLFPIGHLRAMHGDVHRHYRQIILRGLRSGLVPIHGDAIRADIQRSFQQLVSAPLSPSPATTQGTPATTQGTLATTHGTRATTHRPLETTQLIGTLREISTRMLLRLFLGIDPASQTGKILHATYDALTPGLAPAFSYQTRSPEFERLIEMINTEATRLQLAPRPATDSVLARLVSDGSLDPTSRGILVYMLETGRFDLYSLFRWTLYYLAKYPGAASVVITAGPERSPARAAAAEAFVLETLRSNQSEAIQRQLDDDHHFAGFALPAKCQIQVCMWETHKDPDVFPEPFRFEPARFMEQHYGIDRFAPFGVDDHRCAAADYVVALTSLFVEEVAQAWTVRVHRDAAPIRGNYHWEPGPDLTLVIQPRAAAMTS